MYFVEAALDLLGYGKRIGGICLYRFTRDKRGPPEASVTEESEDLNNSIKSLLTTFSFKI